MSSFILVSYRRRTGKSPEVPRKLTPSIGWITEMGTTWYGKESFILVLSDVDPSDTNVVKGKEVVNNKDKLNLTPPVPRSQVCNRDSWT